MNELLMLSLLTIVGILAGIVNAAAGLASLISYPAMLAMGMPPVIANVTGAFSTITGTFSAVLTSHKELKGNRRQILTIIPLVLVGSIIGAFLLFMVSGRVFADLIPICIIIAGIILIKPRQARQAKSTMAANTKVVIHSRLQQILYCFSIFLVGIYAGFFNAGAGVIMLTLLTVINRRQSFAVNNALKNVAMAVTNTTAWIIYAYETTIHWNFVLPLMVGNIIGGILGPIIVRHVPGRLMQIIIAIGSFILAISLIIKNLI